jgi:hypothetical protein
MLPSSAENSLKQVGKNTNNNSNLCGNECVGKFEGIDKFMEPGSWLLFQI